MPKSKMPWRADYENQVLKDLATRCIELHKDVQENWYRESLPDEVWNALTRLEGALCEVRDAAARNVKPVG